MSLEALAVPPPPKVAQELGVVGGVYTGVITAVDPAGVDGPPCTHKYKARDESGIFVISDFTAPSNRRDDVAALPAAVGDPCLLGLHRADLVFIVFEAPVSEEADAEWTWAKSITGEESLNNGWNTVALVICVDRDGTVEGTPVEVQAQLWNQGGQIRVSVEADDVLGLRRRDGVYYVEHVPNVGIYYSDAP